ncbi:hypothetical protein [Brachyspira hyodysenteriae]|uniref:hypothetical protein n=1 Tax=Brachyspira hyodysenteriae TaxID=159 RepID=UPI00063DD00A|nr:hypothetical protein [Brachyspira hyodysenteriae]KLI18297.1 hypothetical protein SU45_03105 [Brachyspira hyodysenteriae]KLI22362.1 hypothetical protein SU43_08615 [Brachyspira hyodysenteriae]KLI61780.1 hypothetical protein SZ46_05110 [Brachyspira hyodysenteriae]MDA0063391.1 hypothetical protein [Brachyspira hyodysenteriae]MDA0063630.1 hypothetical protein [Brachyspira hyodysenteriae]
MFKLILIFLIGVMVLFSFIGVVKYYNKFMNEVEGTFRYRLKALIKEKTSVYYFIKLAYGCLMFFMAIIS